MEAGLELTATLAPSPVPSDPWAAACELRPVCQVRGALSLPCACSWRLTRRPRCSAHGQAWRLLQRPPVTACWQPESWSGWPGGMQDGPVLAWVQPPAAQLRVVPETQKRAIEPVL